jgi:hypothetical protein
MLPFLTAYDSASKVRATMRVKFGRQVWGLWEKPTALDPRRSYEPEVPALLV